MLTLSSLWPVHASDCASKEVRSGGILGVLEAALLYTLESRAGMSWRLLDTGIRSMMPGRRTVSLAKGMIGRVACFVGAIWAYVSVCWLYEGVS